MTSIQHDRRDRRRRHHLPGTHRGRPVGRRPSRPRRHQPGAAPGHDRLPDQDRRRGHRRGAHRPHLSADRPGTASGPWTSRSSRPTRPWPLCRPALVERTRIGLVLGTCNAGLLSAREWLRRRAAGDDPDPRLAALVTPGGARRRAGRGVRPARAGAGGEHRLRVRRQCDRARRRPAARRSRRRGARRRHRRAVRHRLRRIQRPAVAVAHARGAVLRQPPGPLARRGQRHGAAGSR